MNSFRRRKRVVDFHNFHNYLLLYIFILYYIYIIIYVIIYIIYYIYLFIIILIYNRGDYKILWQVVQSVLRENDE